MISGIVCLHLTTFFSWKNHMHVTNPLKLAVLLAISALSFQANASLNQIGSPSSEVAVMQGYGVPTSIKKGLESIIPENWDILIQDGVKLPPTIGWSDGATWISVLEKFAKEADPKLAVTIDWTSSTVVIKDEASVTATPLPRYTPAIEEKGTTVTMSPAKSPELSIKQSIQSATLLNSNEVVSSNISRDESKAVTAVSQVSPNKVTKKPTVVKKSSAKSKSASDVSLDVPVIQAKVPAQLPVISPYQEATPTSKASLEPEVDINSNEFKYFDGKSINKSSVRHVAQGIALRHNLRLMYLTQDSSIKGPVTVLGKSAANDVELLNKALGIYSPVRAKLNGRDLLIVDTAKVGLPADTLIADYKANSPSFNKGKSSVNGSDYGVASSEKSSRVGSLITFDLKEGDALEEKLAELAKQQGYTLEWTVAGGFESNHDAHFEGASIKEILAFLPSMDLSVDIYTQDRHIVVRPGDLTASH